MSITGRPTLSSLTFALVLLPVAASAEEVAAKPGAETIVASGYTYTDNCQGGTLPVMRVTAGPSNGTAEIRKLTFRNSANGPCPGVLMKAVVVVYKSRPGFRGTDSLRYEQTFEQYVGHRGESWSGATVTIQVK